MKKAFTDHMLHVGQQNDRLVVLVGDIGHFALQPFARACPGRFYNVGILESTIISMAAGLSHAGFHPVTHTIAPFITERSLEQIKLDFCYQNLGGNIVTVGSAFDYSGLGCTHHCYDDMALIAAQPNTEVIYPAMPGEFTALFDQAWNNDRLTYFRLPGACHGVAMESVTIKFGQGILVRPGRDITLIGAGPQLRTVMETLPLLANLGIDAEILHFPTIKPFHRELVQESVRKTRRVLVIEEHIEMGGLGDAVLRAVFGLGEVRYRALNIPNRFLHGYGSYAEHCQSLGFTPDNIAVVATELTRGKDQ